MTRNNIKLVAIDLDGTLLNSSHELSAKTIEVLRKLSAEGVMICIATGRSTQSIRKYLEILDLKDQPLIPCISYNGAVGIVVTQSRSNGVTKRSEKLVFHSPVPNKTTKKLIQFAQNHGWVTQVH